MKKLILFATLTAFMIFSVSYAQALTRSDFVQYVGKNVDITQAYSEYRVCNPTALNFAIPQKSAQYFDWMFNQAKGSLKSSWLEIKDNTTCSRTVYNNVCNPYTELNGTLFANCTYIPSIENYTCEQWKVFNPVGYNVKAKTCYNIRIYGTYDLAYDKEIAIDNVISFAGYTFNEYDWWNTTWLYKKSIPLKYVGSNTTFINGTLELNIPYASGKMQRDFEDLRFVINGATVLKTCYLPYNTSANYQQVLVLIPSINNTQNLTVEMYYGNSLASRQENCRETLNIPYFHSVSNSVIPQWTDFETGGYTIGGSSNGVDGWTDAGGNTQRTNPLPSTSFANGTMYIEEYYNNGAGGGGMEWDNIGYGKNTSRAEIYHITMRINISSGTNHLVPMVRSSNGKDAIYNFIQTDYTICPTILSSVVCSSIKVKQNEWWRFDFWENATGMKVTQNVTAPNGTVYNIQDNSDVATVGYTGDITNIHFELSAIAVDSLGFWLSLNPDLKFDIGAEAGQALPSISLVFNFTSVSFGSLTDGSSNNPATNNYSISVTTDGGCTGRLTFYSNTTLTNDVYTIPNSNFKMNYTVNAMKYPDLLNFTIDRTINVADADNIYPAFYLDIPNKQYAVTYSKTMTVGGWCV